MNESVEENPSAEDSAIEQEDAPEARRPRPRMPEYANRILGRPIIEMYDEEDDDDDVM